MILCDLNVWIALALSGHVHHATVSKWLHSVTEPASLLFCRATQQGLLRLLTNTSVLAPYGNPALTNDEAWAAYEAFLKDFRVEMRVQEPPGLETRWQAFACRGRASPKLWMDAYLAAFALAGRLKMVTTDAAFSQFAGLDVLVLTSPQRSRSA